MIAEWWVDHVAKHFGATKDTLDLSRRDLPARLPVFQGAEAVEGSCLAIGEP